MWPFLIPKSDKNDSLKKKLQANNIDEHKCKNPQQNTININLTIH